MDDLIFDRIAALRIAADARAERIHERAAALEAQRRDLHARMEALHHLTISPAAQPVQPRPGGEPAASLPVSA